MKAEILCKDGIIQTYHVNPNHIGKLQEKYREKIKVVHDERQNTN